MSPTGVGFDAAARANAGVEVESVGFDEAFAPAEAKVEGARWRIPAVRLQAGAPGATSVINRLADDAYALKVLEGMLVCDIRVRTTTASALFGPGDFICREERAVHLLDSGASWNVAAPSRLAVFNHHFSDAAAARPELAMRLVAAIGAQTGRLVVERAVSQMPGVSERIVSLFWLLAERWGRVAPTGMLIPLALTHETIGRLIGARRPTVSLALKELSDRDALTRRDDGSWLLSASARQPLSNRPVARRCHSVSIVATRLGDAVVPSSRVKRGGARNMAAR
jgi:CRP-like cAMP-binding protein